MIRRIVDVVVAMCYYGLSTYLDNTSVEGTLDRKLELPHPRHLS